ncbi:hypothetical protein E8E11_004052 [Didymella keratinophila]|nr:hypothetical protein E8E11_004052 [Didymella keratinophila]
MANIGGIATQIFSQSDYTRYARKPGDQVLAQLVMVPLGTIVVACIGIVCTSCAAQLYAEVDKLLWQPYAFLDALRKYEDNSGARAGVAFASLAFIFSQYGMVVASNAVVAGIDLATLLRLLALGTCKPDTHTPPPSFAAVVAFITVLLHIANSSSLSSSA